MTSEKGKNSPPQSGKLSRQNADLRASLISTLPPKFNLNGPSYHQVTWLEDGIEACHFFSIPNGRKYVLIIHLEWIIQGMSLGFYGGSRTQM
jgi:hypothetical protein